MGMTEQLIPVRYTVLGTIDGVVACLAIVLGAMAVSEDPGLVIAAGFSGAIGLGVSNGVGGFMAERTVETRKLRRMERTMVMKKGELDGTVTYDRIRKKLFRDTITHGGCSFGGALVPIIPFMIPSLSAWDATIVAVVVSLSVLFGLGVYAGVMTKENLIFAGLKMMAVGIVVAVFIWAVEFSGLI